MLTKLLKYEIPAVGRKLIPLFIAWIAASCLLGISMSNVEYEESFFAVISILIYIMVVAAVFAVTVIMIVQRYRNSLLGDEAYFNLTLPVSMFTQIGNKTISAMIWVLASGIVALISAFLITIIAGENLDWAFWKDFFASLKTIDLLILIEFIVLGILSIVKSVLAIYAALTLGHQFPQHVWLASIGAYIVLMVIEGSIGRVVMALSMYAEESFFLSEEAFVGQPFMLLMLLLLLVLTAGYFIICKYVMEKRLNLE